MTPFDIVEPGSLDEAVSLLDPEDTSVRPVGGATALMLMMKPGIFQPTRLVSLRRIEKRYSEIDPDIFGEQLDEPGYEDVERIAAIGAVIVRAA